MRMAHKTYIMLGLLFCVLNIRAQEAAFPYPDIPDEVEEEAPDIGTVPLELMQRLIEELPTGYRAVFNLYVFVQLSHKEIAEEVGIKEKSSSSQFLRARMILAKKIQDYIKQQTK